MRDSDNQAGDEKRGLIALVGIIVGLLLVGVLQFSITWFAAR
jgi:hypothetical protein